MRAWEGHARRHGIKDNPGSALTGDDVTELRKWIDEND